MKKVYIALALGISLVAPLSVLGQATQPVCTTVAQCAALIADLQAQIVALQAGQGTSPTPTPPQATPFIPPPFTPDGCPVSTQNLSFGDSGSGVSNLQQFLKQQGVSIYPEGLVTGFFGPATENAVQRFQIRYVIVPGGTPETTGYGVVGPHTRVKIAELCGVNSTGASQTIPSLQIASTASGQAVEITSVLPALGPVGTTVEIRGRGFSASNNTLSILLPTGFTAVVPNIASLENGTLIRFTIPETVGGFRVNPSSFYRFAITNVASQNSNVARFAVTEFGTTSTTQTTSSVPAITSVQSRAANTGTIYVGEISNIYGTGLSGLLAVRVGSQTISVTSTSDTFVQFTVPSLPAGSANVSVTNASGQTSNVYPVTVVVPSGSSSLSTKFSIGDRVVTTSALNVRASSAADAPLLGTVPAGTLGTVVAGPASSGGYIRWQVRYDNPALTAWSAEDWLIKSTAVVTTSSTSGSASVSGITTTQATITWPASGSANSSYACVWPSSGSYAARQCYGIKGGNQAGTSGSNTYTNLQPGTAYSYEVKGTVCPTPGGTGCGYDYPIASGSFTTLSSAATVTVISPNGGETWQVGSTQTVQWTSTNYPSGTPVSIVLIRRTSQNPNTYEVAATIGLNSANDGSETWIVPNTIPIGSYYFVQVGCTSISVFPQGCNGDQSDAPFSIVAAGTSGAAADLVADNVIAGGTPLANQSFNLQFVIKNTGTAASVASGGSYQIGNVTAGDFNVPALAPGITHSLQRTFSLPAGTYIVKLCANVGGSVSVAPESNTANNCIDRAVTVASSATAISSVTVLSPNGGEQILTGPNNYQITYRLANLKNNANYTYRLELWQNGILLGNRGTLPIYQDSTYWNFSWQPGSYYDSSGVYRTIGTGSGFKIKLTLFENNVSVGSDESDAPFSIVAAPATASANPVGYVGPVTSSAIYGWACVPGSFAQLPVTIYFNGASPRNVIANVARTEAGFTTSSGCTDTLHGFVVTPPTLPAGTYNVTATAQNVPGTIVNLTPLSGQTTLTVPASTASTPLSISISPISGALGSTVTLTNNGTASFSSTGNTVQITNSSLQVVQTLTNVGSSNNAIILTVPTSLSVGQTYKFFVLNASGQGSNQANFTVTAGASVSPTISNISPSQGTANTSVTIYGTNLTSGGNPSVEFYTSSGSLAGTAYFVNLDYISAQSITFKFPSIANTTLQPGVYQIGVSTPAGTSNRVGFTLTAPATVSANPVGYVGPVSTSAIYGWACVPGSFAQLPVTLYFNGASPRNVIANVARTEAGFTASSGCTDTLHGFVVTPPTLPAGTYNVTATAQNVPGTIVNLTPLSGQTTLTVPASTASTPLSISISPTSGALGSTVTLTNNGTASFSASGNTVQIVNSSLQVVHTSTNVAATNNMITYPTPSTLSVDQTYRFFVSNASGQGSNQANFTVTSGTSVQKSITVLSPNGGEEWFQSSTQVIRWTSAGNVPVVDITTADVPSVYIASSIANTGTYTWTIPTSFAPGQYKLRIAEPTGGADKAIDESNGFFTIRAPATVSANPVGYVGPVSTSAIYGWACVPGSFAQLPVTIYFNGANPTLTPANVARTEAGFTASSGCTDTFHGFAVTPPTLPAGTYNVTATAQNPVTGAAVNLTPLSGQTTLTVPASTASTPLSISVNPISGALGSTVTLTNNGTASFSSTGNTVQIVNSSIQVVQTLTNVGSSNNTITLTVPTSLSVGQTYKFFVSNASGQGSNQANFTVTAGVAVVTPSITGVSPASNTITAGQPTTFTISGTNFKSDAVIIYSGSSSGTIPPTSVSPGPSSQLQFYASGGLAAGTYSFYVRNVADNQTSNAWSYGINPAVAAQPSLNVIFNLPNPATITSGQSAILSWTISGAASCSISPTVGAITPTTGQTSVSPTTDTVYTLSCTSSTGAQTQGSQTVRVTAPSVVTSSAVTISGIAPSSAPIGTTVTVNGSGFSATNNTVNVYGPDPTTFQLVATYIGVLSTNNGTAIQLTVPASFSGPAGVITVSPPQTYRITVTNTSQVTSNLYPFYITATVTRTSPTLQLASAVLALMDWFGRITLSVLGFEI